MNVTFGLFTDETYFLNDTQARRPPAQYVCAIMQNGIGYNIINIANQLSFVYQGPAPVLQVFVSRPNELTKAADFICVLEQKQEV